MDPSTLGVAAIAGMLLAVPPAFLLGRRAGRRRPELAPEWKLRLRAREDDVADAEARAADAAVSLQAATAALARATARLAQLEAPSPSATGTDPDCPDPGGAPSDPVPRSDDLTLVTGLGAGDAALLEAAGITTFERLAQLGGEGAVVPESVADQLADRLAEWAPDARRLARLIRDDPA